MDQNDNRKNPSPDKPAATLPLPMNIGTLPLANQFLLAPLAGYSDLPFRLVCREQGAACCYSEMISSHGLVYGQEKTFALLQSVAEERPVAYQLFGADPGIMAEAAAVLESYPYDILDINMGCPVRKVVRKGAGAALMKDIRLAGDIIAAICRQTSKPVTVKIRSGWNRERINAAEFAQMAEDCGAAAVIVHARTWSQGFGGTADWQVIGAVKQSVAIPVIGNGDIHCHADGLRMMAETGCDGVMIGRGALGNPWLFNHAGRPAGIAGRRPVILRHLELAARYLPAGQVHLRMKNHLSRYLANIHGATSTRKQLMACSCLEELTGIIQAA